MNRVYAVARIESVEGDFPDRCDAGFYGDSYDISQQSSPSSSNIASASA